MFGCVEARLCGIDPMDPQHCLCLLFVNEHGAQREMGKEVLALRLYTLLTITGLMLSDVITGYTDCGGGGAVFTTVVVSYTLDGPYMTEVLPASFLLPIISFTLLTQE